MLILPDVMNSNMCHTSLSYKNSDFFIFKRGISYFLEILEEIQGKMFIFRNIF